MTIPDLIGNYAVMRLADMLLWEKVNKLDPQSDQYKKLWKQRIDIISRCANMRLYITERMLSEDVDTVEANGLVAMLKPVNYTESGWLVEIKQNGEKI